MTTIAANRECMAADQFVSYAPAFTGDRKIWVARGAIWGAAGPSWKGLAFKAWTLGNGRRPKFLKADESEEEDNEVKLEVLQLTLGGIYLWINGDLPDPVHEPYYAIGSGAGPAIGALTMGATMEEALKVAERWDSGTRGPFDIIALKDIGKRSKHTVQSAQR